MTSTTTDARGPAEGYGRFTRGGFLRGGPSAVAAQILLLAYLIGFSMSVLTAVTALSDSTSAASSTAQRETPRSALTGYLILLVLALLAAWVGMRAARRRLGLDGVKLGLRSTALTRRRAPVAAVLYVGLLAGAVEVTITVLGWCGVHGSSVAAGIAAGPGVLPVESLHAAIAGVIEEPGLLALPVALGRACRWPWPVTLTVMIALRVGFHIIWGGTACSCCRGLSPRSCSTAGARCCGPSSSGTACSICCRPCRPTATTPPR